MKRTLKSLTPGIAIRRQIMMQIGTEGQYALAYGVFEGHQGIFYT